MNIYQKAVDKWGNASQMMMAQEECGELIACISQFTRGRKSKYHLAEEVADVEIMCEQLRYMIGSDIVDKEKTKKAERLAERLGLYNEPDDWPCQQLMGGTGAAIYSNIDGMCRHPECHPYNAVED